MKKKTDLHKKIKEGARLRALLMVLVIICSMIIMPGRVLADDSDEDTTGSSIIRTQSEEHEEEPDSSQAEPEEHEEEPAGSEAHTAGSEAQPEEPDEKPDVKPAPTGAITIKTQPKDLDLVYGHTSDDTLTVEAVSNEQESLEYQWYKGESRIDGATKSSYTIPSHEDATESGVSYHCIITAGNATARSDAAKVRISKRVASLQIKGSLVYNGKDQEPEIVVGNLVKGDICDVTVSVSGEHKNASTSYTATATGLSDSNYELPKNCDLEFTISKKVINLVWSPDPCTFPYSGYPQAPTATTAGFAPEDKDHIQISISIQGDHVEAGDYTATATLTGSGADNYDISDPTQDFSITPSPDPVDKSTLDTLLTKTTKYYDSIKKEYKDIAADLKKSIDSARAVYDNESATSKEVSGAVSKLTNAYDTAKNEVDSAAANYVAAMIHLLPKPSQVTVFDKNDIEDARKAYDKLTSSQKDRIDAKTLNKLINVEDALEALEKPTLKIYPIGNEKEYGDDDPVLTYWIEEVWSGYRIKSTDPKAQEYNIKGKLIRERGEARGSYRVLSKSDMDYYDLARTLRSDDYNITVVDGIALTIREKNLTSSMITLTPASFVYNGSVRKIEYVTVKNGSSLLERDSDYEIDKDSVLSAVGSSAKDESYTVKVTGKRNYTGTVVKTWTITKTASSSAVPSSSAQSSSSAVPSSSAKSSSSAQSSSAAPSSSAGRSSGGSADKGRLEAVNTGVPEATLKKLADNTRLGNKESALKSILGEDELKILKQGGVVPEVALDTKVMTEVGENEKKLTETSIDSYASTASNLTAGAYLDISLNMNMTGNWQPVTSMKTPVEVVINVPEEFRQLSDKFFILRIHNGQAALLFDKDEDPNTISFDSDQFSTYVLMYPAKQGAPGQAPAATSMRPIIVGVAIGLVILAIIIALVVIFRRRARRRSE